MISILFYILFGFLFLRLLVALTNVILNPKLPVVKEKHEEKLSILIPARNEAKNIAATIRYVLQQNYPNYELVVLDDHSTDETATIVHAFAEMHSHIKLISGKILPKGWLGKNWACHQLAQVAKGDYFLFIDADVAVCPNLFSSALSQMKKKRLSLLSIFPDQELQTLGEQIAVPIMHFLLLTMLPLRFIRWFAHPSLAAANGQFMLFDSETYRLHSFHKQVKAEVTEDIEIVKYIKKQKLHGATYLGNGLVHCRMYSGWMDTVQGFSKNLLAGFGSIAGLVLFVFLVGLGYVVLLLTQPSLLLYMIPLIIVTNLLLAQLSNQSMIVTVMLHPLKILSLCLIACLSIYRKLTKTNQWKGRNISID